MGKSVRTVQMGKNMSGDNLFYLVTLTAGLQKLLVSICEFHVAVYDSAKTNICVAYNN